MCNIVFFIRGTELEGNTGRDKVMDTVEQRYIEVGAKTEKEGRGEMNNSLTVGMKQPVRVLGAVCGIGECCSAA